MIPFSADTPILRSGRAFIPSSKWKKRWALSTATAILAVVSTLHASPYLWLIPVVYLFLSISQRSSTRAFFLFLAASCIHLGESEGILALASLQLLSLPAVMTLTCTQSSWYITTLIADGLFIHFSLPESQRNSLALWGFLFNLTGVLLFILLNDFSTFLPTAQIIKTKERAMELSKTNLNQVAHELRNPLSALQSIAEMLLKDPNLSEYQRDVKLIDELSNNMLQMLNDLLDASKLSANKMTLVLEDFDLHQLILRECKIMERLCARKGLELLVEYPYDVQSLFYGDSGRIRQVLSNLLTNAQKFTHQGYILVKVRLIEELQNAFVIKCSVKDTGIGISKSAQTKLFKEFSQVGVTAKLGSGLGLFLVKEFVELMGGHVTLKSELGKGSEFGFVLTLEKSGKTLDEQSETRRNSTCMERALPKLLQWSYGLRSRRAPLKDLPVFAYSRCDRFREFLQGLGRVHLLDSTQALFKHLPVDSIKKKTGPTIFLLDVSPGTRAVTDLEMLIDEIGQERDRENMEKVLDTFETMQRTLISLSTITATRPKPPSSGSPRYRVRRSLTNVTPLPRPVFSRIRSFDRWFSDAPRAKDVVFFFCEQSSASDLRPWDELEEMYEVIICMKPTSEKEIMEHLVCVLDGAHFTTFRSTLAPESDKCEAKQGATGDKSAHGKTGADRKQCLDKIPRRRTSPVFRSLKKFDSKNFNKTYPTLRFSERRATPRASIESHEFSGPKTPISSGDVFSNPRPDGEPVASTSDALEIQSNSVPERQGRVLIVDDNVIHQRLLKRQLEKLGVSQLDMAVNGYQAFQLFSTYQYRLILMDINMPGMDGYSTAEAIRLNEREFLERQRMSTEVEAAMRVSDFSSSGGEGRRKATVIIALTADSSLAGETDGRWAVKHGFDDVIVVRILRFFIFSVIALLRVEIRGFNQRLPSF
ncbi:uncharacterized protein VTP21DRAFT_180 [Calcarisporiella thermophila]|uniref:uncharacterized protein n=1 Tax=Calcarisporiella thermophila TaxID=911321 RepID=UPI00374427DF